MQKSTVIEILKTFTKEEVKEFEDFAGSPFFNKNKSINKLYGSINKHHPGFESDEIKKENLWKKLYPDKKYNYGTMKNLIFDLNKLVLKFVELNNHSSKKIEIDFNLIEEFNVRGLYSMMNKKIEDAKLYVEKAKYDNNHYYYKYILGTFESINDYDANYKGFELNDFLKNEENLSLHYYSNRLYQGYIKALDGTLRNDANQKDEFLDDLLISYEKNPNKSDFTDIIYLALKIMYKGYNKEAYLKLKKMFFKIQDYLNDKFKYKLLMMMINACMHGAINNLDYCLKEQFMYEKLIIKDDLYIKAGSSALDESLFFNLIDTAIYLKEYKWVEEFIEENSKRLLETKREIYKFIAFATVYMGQKKYYDAYLCLGKCDKLDKGIRIKVKYMQFIVYYELGYNEELKYLIDTAKHTIKDNKHFDKQYLDALTRFINVIDKLISYRLGNKKDKIDLSALISFVNKNEIISKKWLIEKIIELEIENKKYRKYA